MKKELGVHPYLFPMPVLMIATYGDDNVVDVMNMAWGGICAENMVSLNIDEDHKTSENIKKRGAFTLSIADIPHIEAADFFGIASGNKMPDKFEHSGWSAVSLRTRWRSTATTSSARSPACWRMKPCWMKKARWTPQS